MLDGMEVNSDSDVTQLYHVTVQCEQKRQKDAIVNDEYSFCAQKARATRVITQMVIFSRALTGLQKMVFTQNNRFKRFRHV